jgi:hypothetical protein
MGLTRGRDLWERSVSVVAGLVDGQPPRSAPVTRLAEIRPVRWPPGTRQAGHMMWQPSTLVQGYGLTPRAAAVTPQTPAGFAVARYQIMGNDGSLRSAVAAAEGDTVAIAGIGVGRGERGPASVAGSDADFVIAVRREIRGSETAQTVALQTTARP